MSLRVIFTSTGSLKVNYFHNSYFGFPVIHIKSCLITFSTSLPQRHKVFLVFAPKEILFSYFTFYLSGCDIKYASQRNLNLIKLTSMCFLRGWICRLHPYFFLFYFIICQLLSVSAKQLLVSGTSCCCQSRVLIGGSGDHTSRIPKLDWSGQDSSRGAT